MTDKRYSAAKYLEILPRKYFPDYFGQLFHNFFNDILYMGSEDRLAHVSSNYTIIEDTLQLYESLFRDESKKEEQEIVSKYQC